MSAVMSMPAAGRSLLPRGALLLSVLAHGALLLWLLQVIREAPPVRADPHRPLEVRWLPAAPPAPVDTPRERAPAPQPSAATARSVTQPSRTSPAAPPAHITPADEGTSSPTNDASAAPAAESAPPLDLSVPRTAGGPPSPAQQAAGDPRANAQPAPADAMARRLAGTPERTEQRMAHGGWVVRHGTRCWDVRPARANDLHPFDATARPIPHGVRRCDDD
jgi:cytoskeletal protein RodZ